MQGPINHLSAKVTFGSNHKIMIVFDGINVSSFNILFLIIYSLNLLLFTSVNCDFVGS